MFRRDILRLAFPLLAAAILAALSVIAWHNHDGAAATAAPVSGDVNCSGQVDAVDALTDLRSAASLQVVLPPGCVFHGDVDCSQTTDAVDALFILRYVATLPASLPTGCPAIGSPVGPGAGVVLDDNAVASINGEQLMVSHATGDQMLTADASWSDYFSQIGAQSGAVQAATSAPAQGSSLDFHMVALQAADVGWAARLAQVVAGMAAHPESGYVSQAATLGGKAVSKITVPLNPAYTATYYYAAGDTLFLITSGDESLATAALAALPAASATGASDIRPQADDGPPPGTGPLMVREMMPIIPPVCVGEPYGRVSLQLMAIDAAIGIPVTALFVPTGFMV